MSAEVFEARSLAGLRLENRVVLAAMTRMQAGTDGCATPDMAEYYARYARAGVGLLITEASYTDEEHSRAYFNQPGMANERHAAAWRPVVHAVHAAGRPILLQLQHGGRLAEPGLHVAAAGATGAKARGMSWQGGRPYAQAEVSPITALDRERITAGFLSAAVRAREAGFDGVEVHGARGYLLDEWMSAPGWTLEDRLAFPVDVVRAVRRGFPEGVLSFNFSAYKMDDLDYRFAGGAQEVCEIVRSLEDAGVDAFHVTARRATKPEPFGEPLATTVRGALRSAGLVANGGIRTLEDAEQALCVTGADFVSLARALLSNPDWIGKVRNGQPLQRYAPGAERLPILGNPA